MPSGRKCAGPTLIEWRLPTGHAHSPSRRRVPSCARPALSLLVVSAEVMLAALDPSSEIARGRALIGDPTHGSCAWELQASRVHSAHVRSASPPIPPAACRSPLAVRRSPFTRGGVQCEPCCRRSVQLAIRCPMAPYPVTFLGRFLPARKGVAAALDSRPLPPAHGLHDRFPIDGPVRARAVDGRVAAQA
jgi:hypothetical protein